MYRLGIGLLGKGSTNHLHLSCVVSGFRKAGIEPVFIVREDYIGLLDKIDGCDYHPVTFIQDAGWRRMISDWTASVRQMFPSYDVGRKQRIPTLRGVSLPGKLVLMLSKLLARSGPIMNAFIPLEGRLHSNESVQGLDPKTFQQLLILGIESGYEAKLTWWGRKHGISVVHYIGNYDNLSSKGFRGVAINRLLVWGPSMKYDAQSLQRIPEERISVVGSLRYNNALISLVNEDRAGFLSQLNLDPDRKTIMYAGFVMEDMYLEIMEMYRLLLESRDDLQLILRLYPNKQFMRSPLVPVILRYADTLPYVYVSLADPNYRQGAREKEVLHIEEYELINSLKHCDVLINHFSTITIEGCLFDKPVIDMMYEYPSNRALLRPPEFIDFSLLYHTRRVLTYDAVPLVKSREELLQEVTSALDAPARRSEQRTRLVENEIGAVDGNAIERMVEECRKEHDRSAA